MLSAATKKVVDDLKIPKGACQVGRRLNEA
jgi:hypothetical protein